MQKPRGKRKQWLRKTKEGQCTEAGVYGQRVQDDCREMSQRVQIKQSFAGNVRELDFYLEYKRTEFLLHCRLYFNLIAMGLH